MANHPNRSAYTRSQMDDPGDPSIAELMRAWRRVAGLNTAAAGIRLGLSSRAIEDIEQGRRRQGDELARIALTTLIRQAQVYAPGQKD